MIFQMPFLVAPSVLSDLEMGWRKPPIRCSEIHDLHVLRLGNHVARPLSNVLLDGARY